MPLSPLLRPVAFSEIPGWNGDDLAPALVAYTRSAAQAGLKLYRTGALGLGAEAFLPAHAAALDLTDPSERVARLFFETWFRPFRIEPDDRPRGFVTGFYEPVVAASRVRDARFRVPLLARPDDLVDLDDTTRPGTLDPYLAFGCRQPDGSIVEYFERGEIDRGALAGRGLEIAFVENPVDAYFIHVQGAARLAFTDGTQMRVTYAAKSGQRFTGAGFVLRELGEIAPDAVTMQSIRAWFAANPGRVSDILWRNRSYIFFREAPVDDPELGPVAAAKVPLTAGRSIAVDRLLHTFGTPVFVDAPGLTAFGTPGFRRLMIAQDTGSAIVGPARGDLFAGSGDAAGEIAGVVKAEADFYVLVPTALAGG